MKPKPKLKFLVDPESEAGSLSVKYIDIEAIEFLPDNIKAHDKEFIKQSIRDYGFVEPIGINRVTGHDIFGNGRLECLREMLASGESCPRGIIEKEISDKKVAGMPVVRKVWFAPVVDGLSFTQSEEIGLAIRMNRASERGGIDHIRAVAVLKKILDEQPESFTATGYTAADLDHIRQLAKFQSEKDEKLTEDGRHRPEDYEERDLDKKIGDALVKKWGVAYGDLWQIGRHRLKCVDSGDSGAILGVFGDNRYRLAFTSPPYDTQRNYEEESINFTELMIAVSDTMFAVAAEISDTIVNLGPVYEDAKVKWYWNDWLADCESKNQPCYGFYVWDKLYGFPGNYYGRLARAHEFFFHFSNGHAQANKWIETTGASIVRGAIGHHKRTADGGLKQYTSPDKVGQKFKIPDSVIRMRPEMARSIVTKVHPAIFPVELPEFFIRTYSQIDDIVYDPFGGSGTTMVACQNLDRIAYLSEKSITYCALVLERMKITFPEIEVTKL